MMIMRPNDKEEGKKMFGKKSAGSPGDGKTCPKCKKTIDADAKYCPFCGAQSGDSLCEKCGAPISPNSKFCPGCGSNLSGSKL